MAAGEKVSSSFTATGSSSRYSTAQNVPFNAAIWGTFVGTVTLERSLDNGTTWLTVPMPDMTDATFTAPKNFVVNDPQPGTLYRWTCSAYTSGTINYLIGN